MPSCPRCGSPVEATSQFCSNCGTRLERGSWQTVAAPPPAGRTAPKTTAGVLTIVVLAVVLVGLVLAGLALTGDSPGPPEPTEPRVFMVDFDARIEGFFSCEVVYTFKLQNDGPGNAIVDVQYLRDGNVMAQNGYSVLESTTKPITKKMDTDCGQHTYGARISRVR